MIQPSGYFKIHRELFSKPIWINSTDVQKVILITLLGMANFRGSEWDYNGKKFKLDPGQFITSLPSIKKECGKFISTQNIRTALLRFVDLEFLTCKSTNKYRLVTITNWALYQQDTDIPNRQTNRRLTGNQQAPNRHLTSKEEGKKERRKEGKNIYKENSTEFVSAFEKSLHDFIEMRKRIGAPMTDNAVELLRQKLNKMSLDQDKQIEILNQSILSGWKSVYPLKNDQQSQQGNKPPYQSEQERIMNL
jgi:hypothetical protein